MGESRGKFVRFGQKNGDDEIESRGKWDRDDIESRFGQTNNAKSNDIETKGKWDPTNNRNDVSTRSMIENALSALTDDEKALFDEKKRIIHINQMKKFYRKL